MASRRSGEESESDDEVAEAVEGSEAQSTNLEQSAGISSGLEAADGAGGQENTVSTGGARFGGEEDEDDEEEDQEVPGEPAATIARKQGEESESEDDEEQNSHDTSLASSQRDGDGGAVPGQMYSTRRHKHLYQTNAAIRKAVLGRATGQIHGVGRAMVTHVAQLSRLHTLTQDITNNLAELRENMVALNERLDPIVTCDPFLPHLTLPAGL
eukprot:m.16012 g.16012  ORF g.16012 m.16012 type:complete len:212 (-) comp6804_c1_seq1:93-728(-)